MNVLNIRISYLLEKYVPKMARIFILAFYSMLMNWRPQLSSAHGLLIKEVPLQMNNLLRKPREQGPRRSCIPDPAKVIIKSMRPGIKWGEWVNAESGCEKQLKISAKSNEIKTHKIGFPISTNR